MSVFVGPGKMVTHKLMCRCVSDVKPGTETSVLVEPCQMVMHKWMFRRVSGVNAGTQR